MFGNTAVVRIAGMRVMVVKSQESIEGVARQETVSDGRVHF